MKIQKISWKFRKIYENLEKYMKIKYKILENLMKNLKI